MVRVRERVNGDDDGVLDVDVDRGPQAQKRRQAAARLAAAPLRSASGASGAGGGSAAPRAGRSHPLPSRGKRWQGGGASAARARREQYV